MAIIFHSLANDADWSSLKATISRVDIAALEAIVRLLRSRGAISALEETEYLDRDFTAEFSHFYSKLFRHHHKICRRIHFFSRNLADLDVGSALELADSLDNLAQESFLGFVVVRPLPHAPIGRSVLAPPKSSEQIRSKLHVQADYEVHVGASTMRVSGTPFSQQESRVGACAQACIWTAGRHFHTKHRGPWFSVAQITEEASKPTDYSLARTLPAGSGALDLNNMIRALRAMNRQPFPYIGQSIDTDTGQVTWAAELRPREIIHRYVDSGIPVIVGIPAQGQNAIGHAVIAVGQTNQILTEDTILPPHPTRAEFCPHFLVHDDQRGPYLRMPVDRNVAQGDTPYDANSSIQYLLIPLPDKVYVTAEIAEALSWSLLDSYVANVDQLLGGANTDSDINRQHFLERHFEQKVIARTYLTYGWKYRRRIVKNSCSETIKRTLMFHDVPKYVWVTEFGTFDSMNKLNPSDRKIYAHTVVDATSSQYQNGALVLHAPDILALWTTGLGDSAATADQIIMVPDDVPYDPKARGVN